MAPKPKKKKEEEKPTSESTARIDVLERRADAQQEQLDHHAHLIEGLQQLMLSTSSVSEATGAEAVAGPSGLQVQSVERQQQQNKQENP